MRGFLAFLLVAFALGLSSGPAFATPRADCPMAASEPMQAGHQDMDCCAAACAPDCATMCPIGVMPFPESAATPAIRSASVADWIAAPLPSADRSGADPPPRTTFS